MWTAIRRLAALAGLSLLAACADPAIPYDHGSAPQVESIGVLTMQWPDRPVAYLASNVGQSFGLVGGLINAGMEDARASQLHTVMQAHQYTAPERFAAYLHAALPADGYRTVPIEVHRSGFTYLSDYSALAGADAWLDCVGLGWGYMAAGIGTSTPYRPYARIKCRLVRATDRVLLMRDIIFYNPLGSPGNFVNLVPDPAYAFVDFDSLMADPDRAVAGIDTALRSSAQTVATLLK